jgi:hypothetical protein
MKYEIEEDNETAGASPVNKMDDVEWKRSKAQELLDGIHAVYDANSARRAKEAKWRRQADGQPENETKDYPMPNSSNLSPPLALIQHQTMAAEIENYFSVDPFWSFKPFSEADQDICEEGKLLTKYFGILARSDNDLALKKKRRAFAKEVALIGQSSLKVTYYVDSFMVKGAEGLKEVTLHDGPSIDVLARDNLIYPEGWNSFEEMPWVATEFILPEHTVKNYKQQGTWDNVDLIIEDDDVLVDNAIEQKKTVVDGGLRFYEVCFYCDADGDGLPEDHVWIIHESGEVMRCDVNGFGVRPYSAGFYNQDSFGMRGKGTGQICERGQDEVESMHNLRLDNMKIVNMRMLEIERRVLQTNGEEISPGKAWAVDRIGSIKPLQFGEVYPSTMQEEQNVWHIIAQATSMSEVKRGFSDPTLGQRDTFRGQQMRLNQSKGLFGTIVDGLTDCFVRVGQLVYVQLRENRGRVIARERKLKRLTEDEILKLSQIFEKYEAFDGFPFQVMVGAVEAQEGAQLQALQMGAQIYAQWAQQTAPLAQMVLGPQAVQMQQQAPDVFRHFASVYVGSTKFLENTLRLAGIKDFTMYTPDVSKLSYLVELMDKDSAMQVKQLEQMSGVPAQAPQEGVNYNGYRANQGGAEQPHEGLIGVGGYSAASGGEQNAASPMQGSSQ